MYYFQMRVIYILTFFVIFALMPVGNIYGEKDGPGRISDRYPVLFEDDLHLLTNESNNNSLTTARADSDLVYSGSSLWTGVKDVFIDGNYAYCIFVNGLVIIDITLPETPILTGRLYFPGSGEAIYKKDNYVYLADGDAGLFIANVENPVSPYFVRQFLTGAYAWDIDVIDSIAYLADDSGLFIVNAANPVLPEFLGRYVSGNGAHGVDVSDSIAYLAAGSSGLLAVNVGNPANPIFVDSMNTPASATGLFVLDSLAYVADLYGGMEIININTSPFVTVGSYSTPQWAYDIYVIDTVAYIADGMSGLQIVNVANPVSPDSIGAMPTPGWAFAIDFQAGLGCIAGGFGGMHIIDPLQPLDSLEVSHYSTPDLAYDVFVRDTIAYVADGKSGMQILNIADPQNHDSLGQYTSLDETRGVFVSDSTAFIADSDSGLIIVDVSDPYNPIPLDTVDTPGRAYDVFVLSDYAYVADYSAGLQIVNITDPNNAYIESFYDTSGSAFDVFVLDSLAYAAFGSAGLVIVNIAAPSAPFQVGNYDTTGWAIGVYVLDSLAYVAGGYDGLMILDISDPANPILLGDYDTPGYARDVYVQGGRAYLADDLDGISIIDVRNPASPYLLAAYDTPGQARGIAVTDNIISVADQYSLMVFDFSFDCPQIVCPPMVIDTSICSSGNICIEVPISGATSVVSNIGSWSNDSLCFPVSGTGSYFISITASNEYCDVLCEFTVNVTEGPPIETSTDNMSFAMNEGDPPPSAQTFTITSPCDSGSLNWQLNILSGGDWLEVDKTSGSNPEEVTVSIANSADTLSPGVYTGWLEIIDNFAVNSPVYISVTLFIESGVDMGDDVVDPGSSFGIPIYLFTNDSLLGFTIPLKIDTDQPDQLQIDSIVINPEMNDSTITGVIVDDTTLIVYRPIQEPPVPDSIGAIEVANVYFTASPGAGNEVVYIDTTTISVKADEFTYQFVTRDITFVPEFDRGVIFIGGHDVIAGMVNYCDKIRPLPEVSVELTGPVYLTEFTADLGHYGFDSVFNGDYLIAPMRDSDDVGVSVADIIKIRRLLARLEWFDNRYKCIAADANDDGRVSVSDIIKIRRYLAQLEPLAAGNWRFIDADYNLDCDSFCSDYIDYWPYPESIMVSYDGTDLTENDFYGIRIGDVNFTWSESTAPPAKNIVPSVAPVWLEIPDILAETETMKVPITINNIDPVAGLEIHLDYDTGRLRFLGVDSYLPGDMTIGYKNGVHLIWENIEQMITPSRNRQVVMLKFEVIKERNTTSPITFTAVCAVDKYGSDYIVGTTNGSINFGGRPLVPARFALRQNYPNPFNPQTTIELSLPRAMAYSLNIYNIAGQLVRKYDGYAGAGIVQIVWNGRNSDGGEVASGIYLYRAVAGDFVANRKMLLLK